MTELSHDSLLVPSQFYFLFIVIQLFWVETK